MQKVEYLALSILTVILLLFINSYFNSYFNVAEVINKPFQQTNNALTKKDNNK